MKEKNASSEDKEGIDTYTRLLKVRALSEKARTRQRLALLIKSLSDKEPLVRAEAAWVLGKQGDRNAVEVLKHILVEDTDKDVRTTTAAALGELGGVSAQKELQHALTEESNVEVRLEIVRALGRLAVQEDRETLEEGVTKDKLYEPLRHIAESDSNPALRRAARIQLAKLGESIEIPFL